MNVGITLALVGGLIAALLVVRAAGQTKQHSERMLEKYRDLLEQSRKDRAAKTRPAPPEPPPEPPQPSADAAPD